MSLSAPLDAAVGVAHSAIEGLAVLLVPIAGGTAAAVAIVLFTVAVRLLISPLSYRQTRAERRRAALAPRVDELRRQHRNDPAALAGETLALYRANGVGPLTGVLAGLAQAPFFMIMYRVALKAPAGSLLGVPLSAHVLAGLPAFAVLLAIATALAWLSSRRIRRTAAAASAAPNPPAGPTPTRPPRTQPQRPEEPRDRGQADRRGRGLAELQDRRSAGRRGRSGQDLRGRGRAERPGGAPEELGGDKPLGRRDGSEGRAGHGRKPRRGRETETKRDGGVLVGLMPWLPFVAVPAVAWLPLAGALYLVTSMAWTALEHSVAFPRILAIWGS